MWVWYPGQERGTVASVQGYARLARVAQHPCRKEWNQAKIGQGESRGHILAVERRTSGNRKRALLDGVEGVVSVLTCLNPYS